MQERCVQSPDKFTTPDSLESLYSYLQKEIGKGYPVDAKYVKGVNYKKMKAYVESVANDPNREPYSLVNCNCFDFADDVIESGRSNSGGGSFWGWFGGLFGSSDDTE